MKGSTLAERNTSEKARRAAMATKTAMADRKEAEEKRARVSRARPPHSMLRIRDQHGPHE